MKNESRRKKTRDRSGGRRKYENEKRIEDKTKINEEEIDKTMNKTKKEKINDLWRRRRRQTQYCFGFICSAASEKMILNLRYTTERDCDDEKVKEI
jgi:hypothetical protein